MTVSLLKNTTNTLPFKVAQLTDCHLFSSTSGLHYGANVYQHLCLTLKAIANSDVDYVVFTGDLTQDHSESAYQLFSQAVKASLINKPFYFLAGNHDEHALLNKYLVGEPFVNSKEINHGTWRIKLLNSKSDTPAGIVDENSLKKLNENVTSTQFQFLMMHHHPLDVGYSIDQHGLKNKVPFWQAVASANNVKGIACGHVHNAIQLTVGNSSEFSTIFSDHLTPACLHNINNLVLYTCPATSVAFDQHSVSHQAINHGPSYQTFTFFEHGNITCELTHLGKITPNIET